MKYQFAHHRLDAYRVALELAQRAKRAAAQIPRGHRSLADQLLRASAAVVLLIGEGANRSSELKRQRFAEARGEAGEVAAIVELLVLFDFINDSAADEMLSRADRVVAMLTRLIRK